MRRLFGYLKIIFYFKVEFENFKFFEIYVENM